MRSDGPVWGKFGSLVTKWDAASKLIMILCSACCCRVSCCCIILCFHLLNFGFGSNLVDWSMFIFSSFVVGSSSSILYSGVQ